MADGQPKIAVDCCVLDKHDEKCSSGNLINNITHIVRVVFFESTV